MLYSGIDLHERTTMITTVDEASNIRAQAVLSSLAAQQHPLEEPFRVRELAVKHRNVGLEEVDDGLQALFSGPHPLAGWMNQITASWTSVALLPLRDLLRTRLRLVEKRVSARNSVRRLLEKYNVPTPDELATEPYFQASLYEEQIELLADQIRRIERQLQPVLIPNDDIQRLLWIPGIGRIAAFTIYLEVDGIERFPTVKHFFSYSRVVPGADDSGGKRRHGKRKDGNRYLKIAFSHAAVRAIQYYPEIKRFFTRKARQKSRAIARTLVQKELARAVYIVLKDGVDFNHTFKGQPLSRRKTSEWPRRASPGV